MEINHIKKYAVCLNEQTNILSHVIIGRDNEMRSVIQTLTRIEKNCPLLIGDAGTGKTAVVYGIVKSIQDNSIYVKLQNFFIYSLDINLINSGAKYRGDLEERWNNILIEAQKYKDNIILFIDEIHTIMYNKSGETNIGDVLKPYISNNLIRIIGATTISEYNLHIEKDKALKRRFNNIYICEPNQLETLNIIRSKKSYIESFYNIRIYDRAIKYVVENSRIYFPDLRNPDLSLDILYDTASRENFEHHVEPKNIFNIREKIMNYKLEIGSKKTDVDISRKNETSEEKCINDLKKKINELEKEYQYEYLIWQKEKEAVDIIHKHLKKESQIKEKIKILKKNNLFAEAGKLLYINLPQLTQQIEKLEKEFTGKYINLHMDVLSVKKTISNKTGISMAVLSNDVDRMSGIKKYLEKHILGQNKQIKIIQENLMVSFSGFQLNHGPLCVFLLLGPTGTGKTETVRKINQFLFEDSQSLVYIDMSEYKEPHTISNLIGCPPGYIGYEAEGVLTEPVRKRPYSIILLDEIEKAHHDIYDILLPIFDHGLILDRKARECSFKKTLIFMTANILLDPNLSEDKQYEILKKYFRSELISRIDVVVSYDYISMEYIRKIMIINLDNFINQFFENNKIKIEYKPEVIDFLLKISYLREYGVRAIKKVIKNYFISFIITNVCLIKLNINNIVVGVNSGGLLLLE